MLKEVLKALKETKAAAELEVAGDPRTRPGREAQRRQAQAKLPQVEGDFRKEFRKAGFPVFLQGPGVGEFIELAKEETEVVAVDYRKAISALRQSVAVTIGRSQEFGVSGFSALVRECKELASKSGLTSMANPVYQGGVHIGSDEALDHVINTYLVRQLGTDFLIPILETEATKSALDLDCDNPVIPVLLTNVPANVQEAVVGKLFNGKMVEDIIDENPTKEQVVAVFKNIQTTLKQ